MATRSSKIIKPQQIVMLEYFGMPYRKQPKAAQEKLDLLEKMEKLDPVKFEEAYSVVVLHRLPDKLENDSDAISAHKLGEVIAGMFEGENAKVALSGQEESRIAIAKIRSEYKDKMETFSSDAIRIARDAIAEASKKFITHTVKVGNKKTKKMTAVLPVYFDKLLQLAVERRNILLVGPAGCGKTHTAALLAEALDLPYGSQSCSAGVSESVFTGWLLPIGDNGKFGHVMSLFLKCYEEGGVFLLDEMDRADPNVAVFLNQALAQDSFYLPQRFENPQVKKHPDFIAIAAANTFGGGADAIYHSANALDGSTLDRFRMGTLAVDYDTNVEQSLVEADVLDWGLKVRETIAKHRMRRIMSTRVMIDASVMMRNQDWTLEDVEATYFSDWTPEEKAIYARDIRNAA